MAVPPVIRRFLLGPLTAAVVLTTVWLLTEAYNMRFVANVLWFISAPAVVASIQFLSFVERHLQPLYPILLPHHALVGAIVYFIVALLWTAFLSIPYWGRFRIGSLSALSTEIIIIVVAAFITFLAFASMFDPATPI